MSRINHHQPVFLISSQYSSTKLYKKLLCCLLLTNILTSIQNQQFLLYVDAAYQSDANLFNSAPQNGDIFKLYEQQQSLEQQQDQVNYYQQQPIYSTKPQNDNSQALIEQKDPGGWLLQLLKSSEFFNRIDWTGIARALDQIEHFIRIVDTVVSRFRSGTQTSTYARSISQSGKRNDEVSERKQPEISARFFNLFGSKKDKVKIPVTDESIKEMLNKVALFVGWMRLMNQANGVMSQSAPLINLLNESKA